MKKWLASALITIMSVAAGWRVEFTPNPLNVGIQITTECRSMSGSYDFLAVDYVQVAPDAESLTTRRQSTPRGERCTVVAHVFRNPDGATGDPDADYIGESSILVDVQ